MDPLFADAAFAMKNIGDVSEPVLSSFGYHLIRLDGRKPAGVKSFDEVKDAIVAQERSRYIDEQRELALASIRNDPDAKVDHAAIDALVIKLTPEQLKRVNEGAGAQ
jgi:peptidyl-prolyl cis-trans isomerase C